MFLHGGHQHLIFNCLMQLVVGEINKINSFNWDGTIGGPKNILHVHVFSQCEECSNNLPPFVCIGIPLEMSQMGWIGMFRVAGLYMAGVGMGCLGASVAEPKKYLLGASAGVYALIFAHLGKDNIKNVNVTTHR